MESNIAVYSPAIDGKSEKRYGVVRLRYNPVPRGAKDRTFKSYQAINHFDIDTMKEDWSHFYTDMENWFSMSVDSRMAIYIRIFNVLYDGALYVNARCTNDRCDGYETEFDEWYFEDEKEIFDGILGVFDY